MTSRTSHPRVKALQAGEKTYRTGKPCRHGHDCARYTSSGRCIECMNPEPRLREHRMAHVRGLALLPKLAVHPADVQTLVAYAFILNAQRGLPAPDSCQSPARQNKKLSPVAQYRKDKAAAERAEKLAKLGVYDHAAHMASMRAALAAKPTSQLTYMENENDE